MGIIMTLPHLEENLPLTHLAKSHLPSRGATVSEAAPHPATRHLFIKRPSPETPLCHWTPCRGVLRSLHFINTALRPVSKRLYQQQPWHLYHPWAEIIAIVTIEDRKIPDVGWRSARGLSHDRSTWLSELRQQAHAHTHAHTRARTHTCTMRPNPHRHPHTHAHIKVFYDHDFNDHDNTVQALTRNRGEIKQW